MVSQGQIWWVNHPCALMDHHYPWSNSNYMTDLAVTYTRTLKLTSQSSTLLVAPSQPCLTKCQRDVHHSILMLPHPVQPAALYHHDFQGPHAELLALEIDISCWGLRDRFHKERLVAALVVRQGVLLPD